MTLIKTTLIFATAETDKSLRIRFSQIFDSGSVSEKETQNPAGVDTGVPDPWPPLVLMYLRPDVRIWLLLTLRPRLVSMRLRPDVRSRRSMSAMLQKYKFGMCNRMRLKTQLCDVQYH